MKTAALLDILILLSGLAARADAPMRVEDAVSAALAKNPAIAQARLKVSESDVLASEALASVFPSISAILDANTKKDSVVLGGMLFNGDPYNQYEFRLHAAQTIYTYGLISGFDLPRKDKDLNQLDLEIASRDLTAKVLQSFYSVLLDQRNIDTLNRIREVDRQAIQIAERRQHVGRGRYLDVLQARTQLALLAPRVDSAKNQLKTDATTLANLLGNQEVTEIHVAGELEPVALDKIKAAADTSKARLPEYQKVLTQEARLDDERAATLGKDLPQLSATADWGRNAYTKTDVLDGSSTFWALGVQLTVPLFSGLSSLYVRRDFDRRAGQLEAQQAQVANDLALAQVKSLNTLVVAYDSIRSSQEAFDLASQSFDEGVRSFRLGAIDFVQYLQVEDAFFESRVALDQAKYTYVSSLVTYFTSTGLPVDQLVQWLGGKTG